jgi:2-dehydropantoate 2-reductase
MPRFDRLVIVGPGAMGCLHAALMAEAGLHVSLLDYNAERSWYLSQNGITLSFPDGSSRKVPVHCTAKPMEMEPAELVIVAVKAHATAAAIQWAAPVINAKTAVLTLQNGLGNYEILQQHVAPRMVLAGTTASGATVLGPGTIRVAAIGETVLGSPEGNKRAAEETAGCFTEADLPVQITTEVDTALWRKLVLNAAINPLGAVSLRRNGELVEMHSLRKLLGKVAREAHAAALAVGIDLNDMDPVALVEEVCRKTATNQCSMLQDILAGRKTEIQQINGELVKRAKEKKAKVALNEALIGLVEAMK